MRKPPDEFPLEALESGLYARYVPPPPATILERLGAWRRRVVRKFSKKEDHVPTLRKLRDAAEDDLADEGVSGLEGLRFPEIV